MIMKHTASCLLAGVLIGLSWGIPIGDHLSARKALDWSRTARLTCTQAVGSIRSLAALIQASGASVDSLREVAAWYADKPRAEAFQMALEESTHHVESHLTEGRTE